MQSLLVFDFLFVIPLRRWKGPTFSSSMEKVCRIVCLASSYWYHNHPSLSFLPLPPPSSSYTAAVAERPQHMLMRVAVGIHGEDIDAAIEVGLCAGVNAYIWHFHCLPACCFPYFCLCQTYTLMSERWFTHASPTLFNSGTCRPQLSSCFLLCMKDDSIEVRIKG